MSKTEEQWNKFFQSSNFSIYDIIDNAVSVAASDYPDELKLRRDKIVEKLYSCKSTENCCDNKIESEKQSAVCKNKGAKCRPEGNAHRERGTPVEEHGHKDRKIVKVDEISKCATGRPDGNALSLVVHGGRGTKIQKQRDNNREIKNVDEISKCRFDEAEVLADLIEREDKNMHEVLEIKEQLESSDKLTEGEILESLRKLQPMVRSLVVLQTTKIGKKVNDLKKHWSRPVSQLARRLVCSWKRIMDECISKSSNNADASKSKPYKHSTDVEESGLPTPPMDEGFIYFSQSSMDVSNFFDCLDDDGNPKDCHEVEKIHFNERHSPKENKRSEEKASISANRRQQAKQEESIEKLVDTKNTRASDSEHPPQRIRKERLQQKVGNESEPHKKEEKQKVGNSGPKDSYKALDNAETTRKIENTKRKLDDNYQAIEDARQKRKTRFMSPSDLPRKRFGSRSTSFKRSKGQISYNS